MNKTYLLLNENVWYKNEHFCVFRSKQFALNAKEVLSTQTNLDPIARSV